MSDDLDLQERFAPLATAAFVETTDPAVLHQRVARRRRRHRIAVGSVAAAIVLTGSLAALAVARGGRPGTIDQIHAGTTEPSGPTTTRVPGVPASYGTEPRLVLGSVPEGMASQGCGSEDKAGARIVTCTLGIPATAVPDGINLGADLDGAPDDVVAAWDRRDATDVADLVFAGEGDPAFTTIAGRTVLSLGETDRVDGTSFDLPDRVTRSYALLAGPLLIQINAEGVTEDQLATVVRGLTTEPVDLGFAIPDGILPSATRAIAEGQQRLWFQPDQLDPTRSVDNGGNASGITYQVDGQRTGVSVSVVRDVDAATYVTTWAAQQESRNPAAQTVLEDIEPSGRPGKQLGLRAGGAANGSASTQRLAVVADAHTVVLVEGPSGLQAVLQELAGATVVHPETGEPPAATTSTTTPSEEATTTTPPSTATGWYIPEGLDAGWKLDQAAVQGVDGSGQAQLWFDSPAGNLIVITLRVPDGGPWHSDQATPHPVAGSIRPVYREQSGGGEHEARLTARDGANIRISWLQRNVADPDPTDAQRAEAGRELDQLVVALVPATAAEWRAFVAPVAPPAALLEAATLEALPDET
ncbi:MAG: hypothetical protein ACTHN0_10685 [Aquihabitans sp.]